MNVSLLGCGWLGIPLGQKLMAKEFKVLASTTRPERFSVLNSLGFQATLLRIEGDDFDTSTNDTLRSFLSSPVVIIMLPPNSALGDEYYSNQIKSILASRPNLNEQHFILTSSVSVYGDNQGTVDEDTPPQPTRDSGRIQLNAETQLTQAAKTHGFSLTIVRAGGLVGPGRHPGLFLQGKKNLGDPDSVVNLIHQDDLAEAIAILVEKPAPPKGTARVFNAVADIHPTRKSFYASATEALGLETPTFKPESAENPKKVSSTKIQAFTGREFRFNDILASFGITGR
ncbi:MAG TPA: SDR family oxidoreductase [Bdellovibrionales bacterium]|nr:SDR family oxidoreductase [Bdellovibrionales bacterium]